MKGSLCNKAVLVILIEEITQNIVLDSKIVGEFLWKYGHLQYREGGGRITFKRVLRELRCLNGRWAEMVQDRVL